jgi:hypothetical protein
VVWQEHAHADVDVERICATAERALSDRAVTLPLANRNAETTTAS